METEKTNSKWGGSYVITVGEDNLLLGKSFSKHQDIKSLPIKIQNLSNFK